SHGITAVYTPVGFFVGTSGVLSQTVNAVTSTSVASNNNPSVFGQSVIFTATVSVSAPGAGMATGSVDFYDGLTALGSGTALAGSGNRATSTFTSPSLSVTFHTINAVYLPAGIF